MPNLKELSFVCASCGYDSSKWYGKCPECGEWNTMREISFPKIKNEIANAKSLISEIKPNKVSDVEILKVSRVSTGFTEFDRVLGSEKTLPNGGGIVPGSVILLSGDPGIGKSTLLLQTAINLSKDKKVLYVTGEESEPQVALRAERLLNKKNSKLYVVATTDIDSVLIHAEKEKYSLVIIDSIQTMEGAGIPGYAGSIPQVRHATSQLVNFAKGTNVPVFIIGHVTKEGMVAGPQMLSHMVDTVLYMEGEKLTGVRILRSLKNRFGDTSEVGIFSMQEYGLSQITDLTQIFLTEETNSPGSCKTVVMEGSRPILVEIQALVNPTNMPYPRRVASGISEKRLELLLAILQKHAHLSMDKFDVYINVVGGFKISENASDLAICLALFSSLKGKIFRKNVALGEVGLLGEVKKVMNMQTRIKEAKKLGFSVISFENSKSISKLLNLI